MGDFIVNFLLKKAKFNQKKLRLNYRFRPKIVSSLYAEFESNSNMYVVMKKKSLFSYFLYFCLSSSHNFSSLVEVNLKPSNVGD